MPRHGAGTWTATSSSSSRATVSPGPVHRSSTSELARLRAGLERHRRSEADERATRLHRGRGVHEVAAERALRTGRVGPDDRTGIGDGGVAGADVGVGGDLGVACERAEPEGSVLERLDALELDDAVDRNDALGQGRFPDRAPTTRSVPPATGRAPAASAASASATDVAALKEVTLTAAPPRRARGSSAACARARR